MADPTVYPIDPIEASFRMLPLCPQAPEIRSLQPGRYTHSKILYAIHVSLTAHFYSNASRREFKSCLFILMPEFVIPVTNLCGTGRYTSDIETTKKQ